MIRSAAVLLLCGCSGVGAQTNAQNSARLEFEAATIKPTPPYKGGPVVQGCRGGPKTADPARFSCNGTPLRILVVSAYGVTPYRLAAPKWMQDSQVLFDVNAKIPENATREEFNVMFRNLVENRFHLVVHHESREIEQYVLVLGKNGPKFKEAGAAPISPSEGASAFYKNGCPALSGKALRGSVNGQTVIHRQETMAIFASNLINEVEVRKPVRDMTGLTGKYDIVMCWAPESDAPGSGPTLMEALQDQLGPRLESRKAPADVLVVDSAEKTPTEN